LQWEFLGVHWYERRIAIDTVCIERKGFFGARRLLNPSPNGLDRSYASFLGPRNVLICYLRTIADTDVETASLHLKQ